MSERQPIARKVDALKTARRPSAIARSQERPKRIDLEAVTSARDENDNTTNLIRQIADVARSGDRSLSLLRRDHFGNGEQQLAPLHVQMRAVQEPNACRH